MGSEVYGVQSALPGSQNNFYYCTLLREQIFNCNSGSLTQLLLEVTSKTSRNRFSDQGLKNHLEIIALTENLPCMQWEIAWRYTEDTTKAHVIYTRQ